MDWLELREPWVRWEPLELLVRPVWLEFREPLDWRARMGWLGLREPRGQSGLPEPWGRWDSRELLVRPVWLVPQGLPV